MNHPSPRQALLASLVAAALVLLADGRFALSLRSGLALGQPWLFPSLGPTAMLQVGLPQAAASRLYSTVVGHLVGLAAGLGVVWALGVTSEPSVLGSGHLTLGRVLAAGLAVGLTVLGNLLLRAFHPPAAATTLLVALGGFDPSPRGATAVVAGVAITATAGEVARRWAARS